MSNERGSILFQTGRHEAAEQEFRATLAQNSSDALAHAMLGLCLVRREAYAEATAEAEEAIRLRPDWHLGYYALAQILLDRNRLEPAAAAILRAIEIDAFNPEYHGVLSAIRLSQRAWVAALTAADAGLQIDPENQLCLNIRAQALVHLGQRDAATQTIDGALRKNPDNALTHANQGWALLHENKPREALEHFREALRLKPDLEWARAGFVEALKARNIFYRLMLRYFLFMTRLSARAQWSIVVGGYVGYQILRTVRTAHPDWSVFLVPLMLAYVIFALMTWLARPLFDLILRVHPYGRYALSRDQTRGANLFGLICLLALALFIAGMAKDNAHLISAAIYAALLLLPASTVFTRHAGWPRNLMALYCVLLALVAFAIVMSGWPGRIAASTLGQMRDQMITLFILGAFMSSWVANALAFVRVPK